MHEEISAKGPFDSVQNVQVERLSRLLCRVEAMHDAQSQALARELHQKVVGSLSAAKMECDWLLRPQLEAEALRARLQRLSAELGDTIQLTRRVIGELWPSIVGHLGLGSALAQIVAEARARSAGSIELHVEGDADGIAEVPAVALYRLLCEILERCSAEQARTFPLRIDLRRTPLQVEVHVELDAERFGDDDFLLMEERVARLRGRFLKGTIKPGSSFIDVFIPAVA